MVQALIGELKVIRVFIDRCGEALFKNPLFLVSVDAVGVRVTEGDLSSLVHVPSKVIDLRLERCQEISSITPDQSTRSPYIKDKCHV
jgi:hypothetical protein